MSSQRHEELEAGKEKFIDELVYDRHPIAADEVREKLRSLGLGSDPTFVICLCLSGFGHLGDSRREKIRTKALSVLRKMFPDRRRNMIAFLHENSFYVFGCSKNALKKTLNAKAVRAVKSIAKLSRLKVTAGISIVPRLEELRHMARKAVVARRYEFMGLTQQVFWPEDVKYSPRESLMLYSELEEELASAVRIGNVSHTSKIASQIAEKIIAGQLSVMAGIRVEILGMLLTASRAALQGGVDPERIMAANVNCMQLIMEIHDLEELSENASASAKDFAEMVHALHREKRSPVVERAKEHIRKNFIKKITLEGLARASFSSPYHLSRLFKGQEGMSFVDFLNSVRVEEAKKLLCDLDRSVTDVCFDAGFNNLNHLGRTFKKIVGVTPSAYRKSASK